MIVITRKNEAWIILSWLINKYFFYLWQSCAVFVKVNRVSAVAVLGGTWSLSFTFYNIRQSGNILIVGLNKICGCAAGLSLVDCTNKVWKSLSLIEFTGKTKVVDAYWQDLVLVKSTLILNFVQRKPQLIKVVPKCNLW